MIVYRGEIFFDKRDVKVLKKEPEYVKKRYRAVVRTLAPEPFKIIRREAAKIIKISLRQFYRIINGFKKEGIPGLRFKSRRPKRSPNQTPREIVKKVKKVREKSGFGPKPVSDLVNESFKREGKSISVYPSLVYNILVREGEIERERRRQKEWQRFEWGHPDRLIQTDLTDFRGIPILTMEDDHARKGWAIALTNKKDKTVTKGMKKLVQKKYDNLLTDNGSQFSRNNSEIRKYCDEFVREKHIWTSIHHPETLGKLSAYQKGLKRFLNHQIRGQPTRKEVNYWIEVYNGWYNNGKYHSAIKTYPEIRYSGKRDESWYEKLVKALKLEDVLTV